VLTETQKSKKYLRTIYFIDIWSSNFYKIEYSNEE